VEAAPKKSVYTTEEWNYVMAWDAKLGINWYKGLLYRAGWHNLGIEADELRNMAINYMYEYVTNYVNGKKKTKSTRNSWMVGNLWREIYSTYQELPIVRVTDEEGNNIIEDLATSYDDKDKEEFTRFTDRTREAVNAVINAFSKKEQDIVKDYFGFGDVEEPLTQKEIAKKYGYSEKSGWISRIITKAEKELEGLLLENKEIKSYLRLREEEEEEANAPPVSKAQ
jgi:RNA polymerase sigma factor (sigma-70 family)